MPSIAFVLKMLHMKRWLTHPKLCKTPENHLNWNKFGKIAAIFDIVKLTLF